MNSAFLVTTVNNLDSMLENIGRKYSSFKIIVIDLENTESLDSKIINILSKHDDKYVSLERLSISASPIRAAKMITCVIVDERNTHEEFFFRFDKMMDKLVKDCLNDMSDSVQKISSKTITNIKRENQKKNENTVNKRQIDKADIAYALHLINIGTKRIAVAEMCGVSPATITRWDKLYKVDDSNLNNLKLIKKAPDEEIQEIKEDDLTSVQSDEMCDYNIFKSTKIDEETNVRYLKDPDLFQTIKITLENKNIRCKDEDIWNLETIFTAADEPEVLYSYDEFVCELRNHGFTFHDSINLDLYTSLNEYHNQRIEYVDGISMDYV